jgi:hypothetical protein
MVRRSGALFVDIGDHAHGYRAVGTARGGLSAAHAAASKVPVQRAHAAASKLPVQRAHAVMCSTPPPSSYVQPLKEPTGIPGSDGTTAGEGTDEDDDLCLLTLEIEAVSPLEQDWTCRSR